MRFSLSRAQFAQNVGWVARTLPTRPATPVLAGMKIVAEGATLHLSAFDYETSALAEIDADVEEPGTVIVSGRMLAEIAKSLPGERVQVALEGTKVIITSGKAKFTLLSMPAGDYPALPKFPTYGGQIDSAVFAAAIGQVAIAASRDEAMPVLTAVRVVIADDQLKVLATDRYRLARARTTWVPDDAHVSHDLLIRSKVLHDAAKSVEAAGTVTFTVDPTGAMVGFAANGRQVTTMVLAGEYPPVERLFPEDSPAHATVNTAELIAAVKRVALVAEGSTPVRLSFSRTTLTLGAGDASDASASEVLDVQHDGEDITVAFNPGYLLDGLAAMHTPFVRLHMSTSNKPVLMNPVDEQGQDLTAYEYLLVPIRATS